jgi:isopentenyl diphosphate isomerase/L-lactate dehydrogenase-like FMN-dependent dehydrogenase
VRYVLGLLREELERAMVLAGLPDLESVGADVFRDA